MSRVKANGTNGTTSKDKHEETENNNEWDLLDGTRYVSVLFLS